MAGIGAVVLAGVSPLVLVFVPDLSDALAAASGLWLFTGRIFFRPYAAQLSALGAALQDEFDRDALGLVPHLQSAFSPEEVRTWSRNAGLDDFRDWYPTHHLLAWPASVLVCQRSSVVWSRRQHFAFGLALVGFGVLLFSVGLVVALALELTLGRYLIAVLMPSLPALLDAAELARAHLSGASLRRQLEHRLGKMLEVPTSVGHPELDAIQERLFGLRSTEPLVPNWFYGIVAGRYEEDMQYAAATHAEGNGFDGTNN